MTTLDPPVGWVTIRWDRPNLSNPPRMLATPTTPRLIPFLPPKNQQDILSHPKHTHSLLPLGTSSGNHSGPA